MRSCAYPPMAYSVRMLQRLHTVVETPEFVSAARRILTESERAELIGFLAANPDAGDLMQGTGGARKLRWGARGKGKSGGARVITYFGGPRIPVFLLMVFGKGEKANLSKAERNELRQVLKSLGAAYMRGAG